MIDINRNLADSVVKTMAWKEDQASKSLRAWKPRPLPKSNKEALRQLHTEKFAPARSYWFTISNNLMERLINIIGIAFS